MTPPPGDGNPFSSSQDAGANPIDAALDKAARIAETLLENVGSAEPTPGPPTASAPAADGPSGAILPPAEPVANEDLMPVAEDSVERKEPPVEEAVEGPADSAASLESVEPPAPVVPTTEDIPALVGDAPIEDQLERIEGLLDEAQAQIGGEVPAKDRPATPLETSGSPAPDAGPNEVDTSGPHGLPAEADEQFEDGERLEDEATEAEPRVRSPRLDPDSALGQFVILLQDVLCGLLDRLDRPFVKVSYPIRQILGVCALVTLLASIATWILARL